MKEIRPTNVYNIYAEVLMAVRFSSTISLSNSPPPDPVESPLPVPVPVPLLGTSVAAGDGDSVVSPNPLG